MELGMYIHNPQKNTCTHGDIYMHAHTAAEQSLRAARHVARSGPVSGLKARSTRDGRAARLESRGESCAAASRAGRGRRLASAAGTGVELCRARAQTRHALSLRGPRGGERDERAGGKRRGLGDARGHRVGEERNVGGGGGQRRAQECRPAPRRPRPRRTLAEPRVFTSAWAIHCRR